MARYTRLCPEPEVPHGTGKLVTVDNRCFAVFRHQGSIFVIDDVCPHRGGSMSGGQIDADGIAACPWHGWRYSVMTGVNPVNAQTRLPTFNARVVDGWVEAEI